MNTYIKCFCEKIFKNDLLSSHFMNCVKIKDKFRDLDKKISRAIKKYVDNLDNINKNEYINGLFLLNFFFKRYINLVEEIILKNIKEKDIKSNLGNKEIKNKQVNNINEMIYLNNTININNIKASNNFSGNKQDLDIQIYESNINNNQLSDNLIINQIDLEEEITIIFRFLAGQQEKVKAKLGETFFDVFKRFHSEQCPPNLKNYVCYALYKNKLVDNDKTLFENGIKNGESVLFISIEQNYKEEEEENEEDIKEKKKVYEGWIKQYKRLIKNNLLSSDEEEKNKLNSEIVDFFKKKFHEFGMNIKEHKHILIYCKTNFNWTCKECFSEWSKTEPRLFCSICDYNMCNYCRRIKKYYKIGNIPLSALPSNNKINTLFINYSGHKHRLAYCRTKRSSQNIIEWSCDKCKEKFNEKDWTFYCTKCDYDLCSNCAEKENLIL